MDRYPLPFRSVSLSLSLSLSAPRPLSFFRFALACRMIAREERTAGIRERRVRFSVEAPKALPGYSLRGHRLKSLLSFSPFPPIIHPPPRPAPLFEATKMNRPLCLSKVWENSNSWHCIAYFFFSLSLSLSLLSRWEKSSPEVEWWGDFQFNFHVRNTFDSGASQWISWRSFSLVSRLREKVRRGSTRGKLQHCRS